MSNTPAALKKRACLYVLRGPFAGMILEVRRRSVVGRDPACDIVLPDDSISREHAIFIDDGLELTIADVASTNGTYVNGRPIYTPTALNLGDVVKIGPFELEFLERRSQRELPAYRDTRENIAVSDTVGQYSGRPAEKTERVPMSFKAKKLP